MESDVNEKFNEDDNLGLSSGKAVTNEENASSKRSSNRKRKRKRPRTKAFRRTIREKIEIALCTSDSPIQEILKTNKDCIVSAPLSSVIRLLKLDTDEYRRLSCKALISIGALSNFFSIVGDSAENLQLVLKNNGLDHSSTVVYVDNLPSGCKVDALERWAATFGTVVFVHPIMERRMNPDNTAAASDGSTSAEVSTSNAFDGRFFRSAFIKFVDNQSPVDFIKFHQLLRKKAASRRRKKLKLERKKAKKKNSVAMIRIKNKLQRKKRKKKRKAGKKSAQLQKVRNEGEAMETGTTDAEKLEVVVDNSDDVVIGESGNCKRRGKRKRRLNREVNDILIKKSKTTVDEEEKVGTDDAKPNGFKSVVPKKAIDFDLAGKIPENEDFTMEIGDQFTATKNTQQLTVGVTGLSSEKTFRDVGTDVPEDLMSEVGGSGKKRKRVHRQKRRDDKSKNCNLHPKKYFHNIQAYSLDTFQKLRARYLQLQKQQMVQLKASLKGKSVSGALSGLTRKEWRKRRGRCRLMMRAAKLHEEYVDRCNNIQEEDELADAQV